mgnify:CR=1 FL=1
MNRGHQRTIQALQAKIKKQQVLDAVQAELSKAKAEAASAKSHMKTALAAKQREFDAACDRDDDRSDSDDDEEFTVAAGPTSAAGYSLPEVASERSLAYSYTEKSEAAAAETASLQPARACSPAAPTSPQRVHSQKERPLRSVRTWMMKKVPPSRPLWQSDALRPPRTR